MIDFTVEKCLELMLHMKDLHERLDGLDCDVDVLEDEIEEKDVMLIAMSEKYYPLRELTKRLVVVMEEFNNLYHARLDLTGDDLKVIEKEAPEIEQKVVEMIEIIGKFFEDVDKDKDENESEDI